LIDKVAGVGNISISVNSTNGKEEASQSSSSTKENNELARKIKDVVLSVLREEKRLGGILR
jgi:hypothetical protein